MQETIESWACRFGYPISIYYNEDNMWGFVLHTDTIEVPHLQELQEKCKPQKVYINSRNEDELSITIM